MSQTKNQPVTECPACASQQIDEAVDGFDGICEACGLVIEAGMDPVELDWKVTDDGSGQQEQDEWLALATIQNATEQRIVQAFETLEEFADRIDGSAEVRQKAAKTFCDAMRTETTDGREAACVIAACLRVASLRVNEPIPVGRLTEFNTVDQKKFRRSRVALQENLELQLQSPDPEDYLSFVRSALDLEKPEIGTVNSLLEGVAGQQSFVGKDPAGIVAAGVYLIHDEVTQAEVANAVGVSTETVRQRVKQLRELSNHD